MIYTIGFGNVEGSEPVTKETNISNINPENIIVVNANGSNREQWEKVKAFSPAFKFQGLLPTCDQKEQIYPHHRARNLLNEHAPRMIAPDRR